MLPDRRGKRERAAELFRQGARQAAVAHELGVSRVTALAWHRSWLRGGREALLETGRRGPRPRLPAGGAEGLHAALAGSPRTAGIPSDEWSIAAIALLIERRTGVRYHRRHIGRVLRRLGWIIPPFGRHAALRMRGRELRDPDGNPLILIERRED
jgi:putative transposase